MNTDENETFVFVRILRRGESNPKTHLAFKINLKSKRGYKLKRKHARYSDVIRSTLGDESKHCGCQTSTEVAIPVSSCQKHQYYGPPGVAVEYNTKPMIPVTNDDLNKGLPTEECVYVVYEHGYSENWFPKIHLQNSQAAATKESQSLMRRMLSNTQDIAKNTMTSCLKTVSSKKSKMQKVGIVATAAASILLMDFLLLEGVSISELYSFVNPICVSYMSSGWDYFTKVRNAFPAYVDARDYLIPFYLRLMDNVADLSELLGVIITEGYETFVSGITPVANASLVNAVVMNSTI
jgi:hypothetical protein